MGLYESFFQLLSRLKIRKPITFGKDLYDHRLEDAYDKGDISIGTVLEVDNYEGEKRIFIIRAFNPVFAICYMSEHKDRVSTAFLVSPVDSPLITGMLERQENTSWRVISHSRDKSLENLSIQNSWGRSEK